MQSLLHEKVQMRCGIIFKFKLKIEKQIWRLNKNKCIVDERIYQISFGKQISFQSTPYWS